MISIYYVTIWHHVPKSINEKEKHMNKERKQYIWRIALALITEESLPWNTILQSSVIIERPDTWGNSKSFYMQRPVCFDPPVKDQIQIHQNIFYFCFQSGIFLHCSIPASILQSWIFISIWNKIAKRILCFKEKSMTVGTYVWEEKNITKVKINTIQINIGNRCNQACAHCHIGASPRGSKNMDFETARKVLDKLLTLDIENLEFTGGTPELNPNLKMFIEELSQNSKKITVRSSLSVLDFTEYSSFTDLYRKYNILNLHINSLKKLECRKEIG